MLDLIDTHCHIDHFILKNEWEGVLERALENQVRRMIIVGTELRDWKIYQEICPHYKPHLAYTVGLHPCHVDEGWDEQLTVLGTFFVGENEPIAMGEIGLDYFHLPKEKSEAEFLTNLQEKAFRKQLALALQFDCPIIIHSRNAFSDTVKIIDESGVDWNKVVFHCFSEGPEEIKILNERGARGSFTGIITYKNAENIRQSALAQGLDKFMLETDSPYLTPEPYRSKSNEPCMIKTIAEYCAKLWKMSLEDFGKQVTLNSEMFFRWR